MMKIVNKKKFIKSIATLIMSIFLIIILINTLTNKPEYKETYKTIYISEDETLWSIAEEYKKPNQDIRDYIYEIRKLNNMEFAAICEGQELTIIIYEEVK